MHVAVVTLDSMSFFCDASLTVKRKAVKTSVCAEIIKCSDYFKS